MKYRPRLKTARLELRPYRMSEVDFCLRSFKEQPTPRNKWDAAYRPYKKLTRSEVKGKFKRYEKLAKDDQTYHFGIFTSNGELVGEASVMQVMRGVFQSGVIGYILINKHWGKGYGVETARALCRIAFDQLGLNRIEAMIEPRNIRSVRVIRKAGFRKEGFCREYARVGRQWRSSTRYSLTKSEFHGFRGRLR